MTYDPTTIFRGTAWYYARFRPGYMPALFDHLVTAYGLNATTRVVDVGCGTGQLTVPLAQRGVPVVGVDPEPEMLAEAAAASEAAGVAARVDLLQGRAEDLATLVSPPVRLVTFGASFHWTDRDATLSLCDRLVEPAGGVAIVSGGPATKLHGEKTGTWTEGQPTWADVVTRTVQEFLGPRRRAGAGFYTHPEERHAQVLARSPFRRITPWRGRMTITRNAAQIVGLQYSTSYCSPALLGDRTPEFEQVLTERLRELDPGERFVEEYEVEALCATRP